MATAQPIVPFVPVAFGRYWLTATAFLVQVNAGFRALLQSECPQLEVFFSWTTILFDSQVELEAGL